MNFDNRGVIGPDVSFYQDASGTPQQIDFVKMREAGARFVIIRAGQNLWSDPDFVYNWRAAKEAGLPRGSYWFYDSRAEPKEQARLWWNLIKDDIGELPHFLDLEEKYGGAWRDWRYWYDCLYEFQRLSGLPSEKIGIYTGFYWWVERAPIEPLSLAWFRRFPLWLASYTSQIAARVPEPWTECLFWQYGTPTVGPQYGVESLELDMNLFNGDLDKFHSYFSLPPANDSNDGSNEQKGDETMTQYTGTPNATVTTNVRIRRTYPDGMTIGAIQPGQTCEGDRLENDWLHIVKLNGAVIDGWAAAWLLDITEPTPPPAPEEPADGFTVEELEIVLTDKATGKRYRGTVAGLELVEEG